MKKLLALAAAITLLCTAALAEFDFYALKDTPDAMTYTVPGTADTVVRPALAPYQGEFGEDELVAYLDYIILPDEEVATFRLPPPAGSFPKRRTCAPPASGSSWSEAAPCGLNHPVCS